MESSDPDSIVVNRVYRDCPIRIRKYEFPRDLLELSFREFDVILGMDWLSRHQVVVDCRMKRVTLRTPSDEEVTFIGERSNHLSNVISDTTTRMMPIVSDYPNVFLKELPRLPPHREIEFAIDVVEGATSEWLWWS